MQLHMVIRPFDGAQPYRAGEIVDIDGWRHGRSLVERRYIRPATESEVNAATEASAPPTKRGKAATE